MVTKEGVVLTAGVVSTVLGLVLALTWGPFVEREINKALILTEKSKSFDSFTKSRVPLLTKFYFWNWTNPGSLKDPSIKPILIEMGPYTYREEIVIKDLIWNSNGTLSYTRIRNWHHVPELTNGSLDDLVTTVNPVSNAAAYMTQQSWKATRLVAAASIRATQSMVVTKSVREFLFDGYRDPMLETAKALGLFQGGNVPTDRFAWMYKRNGSSTLEGVFNIETGANGMESFGKLRSWNFQNHTPYFADECGAVRGSGGEFFPPKRTKSDVMEFFSPDICRYLSFHFAKEEEQFSTRLYKYETKPSLFDNGDKNPENSCFCSGDDCAPSGIANVSACRMNAPIFLSFPHFYGGSPSLIEAVEGMRPDAARHDSYIALEPTWGILYKVVARLQMNILIQPYDDLAMYVGVPKIYFPTVWFEQSAVLPEETAKTVNLILQLPLIGHIISAVVIATGLSLTVWATFSCLRNRRMTQNKPSDDAMARQEEPMLGSRRTKPINVG